jgi:hypothetical protein
MGLVLPMLIEWLVQQLTCQIQTEQVLLKVRWKR